MSVRGLDESPPLTGAKAYRTLVAFAFLDEAAHLPCLLKRLDGWHTEDIVAVDNGSSDGSADLVRAAGIEVLEEPVQGLGRCQKRIIHHASARRYDVLVFMAGNGKDDPRQIKRLLQPILDGDSDYVQGSRFLAGGGYPRTPRFRVIAIRLLSRIFSLVTKRCCTDLTNGFRAYRLDLFDDSRINIDQAWLDQYEYEYYLHCKVHSLSYRVCEVPVTKSYPRNQSRSYSKIRPLSGWWSMLRPFFYLATGIKR